MSALYEQFINGTWLCKLTSLMSNNIAPLTSRWISLPCRLTVYDVITKNSPTPILPFCRPSPTWPHLGNRELLGVELKRSPRIFYKTNTRNSWALWAFLTKVCSGINREEVHFLCGRNLTDKIQTKFLSSFACNRNKITFLWSSFLSPQNHSLAIWAKRIRALIWTSEMVSVQFWPPLQAIQHNSEQIRTHSLLSKQILPLSLGRTINSHWWPLSNVLKIVSKYCSSFTMWKLVMVEKQILCISV